ncbi:MAG: serine hydrolase [Syntrophobacteraceae bacterium]|nr:serine hydrolase [Syntrophobacteraceae bacterium]
MRTAVMGKKELWLFCVLLLSGTITMSPMAQGSTGPLNCRGAILVDASDGRVLFEQNADAPIPPASITKVLTLYLVFEAIQQGRLESSDLVYVSQRAASAPPTRMGLKAGRTVILEDLLKGMAVVSGNDACIAVAEHMSGSVEGFVSRMNAKARELGMTRSHFKNPNGLPAQGQVTTARDVAKLSMAYLRRFPDCLHFHSMRTYTFNGTTRRNANGLLGTCYGVDGIKTGFVCASGYNLSATAKRGDVRLIAVVLGSPSPAVRARETAKLIEAGFDSIESGSSQVMLVEDSSPGRSARITFAAGGGSGSSRNLAKKKARTEQRAALKKSSHSRLTASGSEKTTCSSGKKGKSATVTAKKVSKESDSGKTAAISKKNETTAARVRSLKPVSKAGEKTGAPKASSKKTASKGKQDKGKSAKVAGKTKTAQNAGTSDKIKSSGSVQAARTSKNTGKVAPSPKNAQAQTAKSKSAAEKQKNVAGGGNGKVKSKSGQTVETPKKSGVVHKSHKDPQGAGQKSG